MNGLRLFSRKLIFPILILSAFCIALPPFFKSMSLVLFALVLLLSGEMFRIKYSFKKIVNAKNPLFWLIALFVVYTFGMLWSKDLDYGLKDLTIKLPLLIVPVLCFFLPKRFVTRKRLWIYSSAFIAGLLIVLFECLIKGLANAFSGKEFAIEYIFYTRLSGGYHVTYLSLFCLVALFVLYKIPLSKLFSIDSKTSFAIKGILFVVLDVFLILLSARIAFIGMILLHVGIAFDLFVFRKQYLKSLSLLLLITIVVFGASNIKTFNQRYQNIDKRTTIAQQGSQKKVSDSLSQRSFIYSNIFELIKRNLVIGYGTGDSRMALEDFYKEKNVSFGRYLNAHNQFLQTAVAVGALGLLCLMMCFVSYLFGFLGKNTYVFLFAIALIGLSMMTEAILERQAGVHFCAFAFCWFVPFMKRSKTKKIRTA